MTLRMLGMVYKKNSIETTISFFCKIVTAVIAVESRKRGEKVNTYGLLTKCEVKMAGY